MEEIILILISFALLFTMVLIDPDDDWLEKIGKCLLCIIALIMMWASGTIFGEQQGAYNQLRNKYEINYTIDKDGHIIDTIINFDGKPGDISK